MPIIIFGDDLQCSNLILALFFATICGFVGFGFALYTKKVERFILLFPFGVFMITFCTFLFSQQFHGRQVLVFICIMLWSTRLFIHMLYRNIKDKEDCRLDLIRGQLVPSAIFFFALMMMIFACSAPSATIFSIRSSYQSHISFFDVIGLLIWVGGFLIESIGDLQLQIHRRNASNQNKIYSSGLYSRMRHPNYFGEILQQIGMLLLTVSTIIDLEWLIVLGPISMIIMILFVSGIPPAEWAIRNEFYSVPQFDSYLKQTWMIFPKFNISSNKNGTPQQEKQKHSEQNYISDNDNDYSQSLTSNKQEYSSSSSSSSSSSNNKNHSSIPSKNHLTNSYVPFTSQNILEYHEGEKYQNPEFDSINNNINNNNISSNLIRNEENI